MTQRSISAGLGAVADRHTRLTDTQGLPVLSDEEVAIREAENGLLQTDRMMELIEGGRTAYGLLQAQARHDS